ncbi:adenosylhomocysteinase [Anaeramoeba flamelloides]|uniref:Adenosylhomocysteinase n=1 Tax=Anaeramoeba flamelloides TaxID=1746091 RepID=A0ABQ8YDH0_9EUKA|nr:adenosylhomocysteinase [Anaeramoeba flamelloides]
MQTQKGKTWEVLDIELAKQGELNVKLAEKCMRSLMILRERFTKEKPFEGLRIAMCLHVTKETAVLVETLVAGGATVGITSCNPLSTQDDVAAYLALRPGINCWAYKGETIEDYYRYIGYVIGIRPHITIDDGCDLVTEIHLKHKELIEDIIGGCEETTAGINRLKNMVKDGALNYPVIAVNDNKTKHLVDNYYGTGQSTIDGIIRATNTLIAGKTFVVGGYGSCGKGVALRAKGMGANVIVTEVDPFRALQAKYDGFLVMPMKKAAPLGDIFLSVTGNRDIVTLEHAKLMKSGAMLANSGHFDCEVDVSGIREFAEKIVRVRPWMEECYLPNGRSVYILGEGRLINLAAGEGHPSEIMSTSFCGQALACEYLVKNKGQLKNEMITLPEELDIQIAKIQLKSMGVEIDELSEKQIQYMSKWKEGTKLEDEEEN